MMATPITPKGKEKKEKNGMWTYEEEVTMLNAYLSAIKKSTNMTNMEKRKCWDAVTQACHEQGCTWDKDQIYFKYSRILYDFSLWNFVRKCRGAIVDPVTGFITLSEEGWEFAIQKKPKCVKFRTKGFVHREIMEAITGEDGTHYEHDPAELDAQLKKGEKRGRKKLERSGDGPAKKQPRGVQDLGASELFSAETMRNLNDYLRAGTRAFDALAQYLEQERLKNDLSTI
ncbi:unnamed protein product [Aphanomyces euteiches]|uniref:Myb/SANT-like domain-containing protein n=1 Tax=Aphanomyces euteiches TaxID=100861 RepID=A0A6G0XP59_9STRA|nr:hypothetical protein Ae201684_002675 [Aphanomyces euteiches]KAH9116672.1 hypothetical protein AeMF1_009399 [Aphanomyces euteiches]KAH9157816.1 hypothetical protein AeRB84_000371 [Aphanomyces euteiches]KAH9163576.1 hypothetical protein LEN26_000429 [Aphanomyces euteiches]